MQATWTDEDTAQADAFWADYQKTHDLSDHVGEAVGVDPKTGRVWFGESALEVVQRMRAEGTDVPLFFYRIGSDHYVRKGHRR
jgi:hypothetical protein